MPENSWWKIFEVHVLFSSWKPILERILASIVYVILMQCLMHMGWVKRELCTCACEAIPEFECSNIPSALETKDHGWKEKLAKRLSLLAGLVKDSAQQCCFSMEVRFKVFPFALVHKSLSGLSQPRV